MKVLLVLFYLLLYIQTSAQQINGEDQFIVPDTVLTQFRELYPKASKMEWSSIDSLYQVTFMERNETRQIAFFTLHGEWIETRSPVSLASLPKKVISGLAENYGDCQLRHASCHQKPKKVVEYTAILKRGRQHLEVRVDKKGRVIGSRELSSLD